MLLRGIVFLHAERQNKSLVLFYLLFLVAVVHVVKESFVSTLGKVHIASVNKKQYLSRITILHMRLPSVPRRIVPSVSGNMGKKDCIDGIFR